MAALYVSLILKVRVAILQNGGIRLCFHAIVRYGRMPPTDTETIGGISTGLSLYSGRVCVPTYSQNACAANSWIFGDCFIRCQSTAIWLLCFSKIATLLAYSQACLLWTNNEPIFNRQIDYVCNRILILMNMLSSMEKMAIRLRTGWSEGFCRTSIRWKRLRFIRRLA